jgi:TATA-binding protein-associated factor
VNWLMFLNRFGLHGILSDEMGLGKTLQTIIAVASDHWHRQTTNEERLPSMVVSPPSVTGHWFEEIQKFVPDILNVLHYTGSSSERKRLQGLVGEHNLIVASYEVVRNDVDFFKQYQWNYCVLDEGHMIRNTKTKVSQSIRQIKALHRLILSGTPIQNSATELWALFDFLMPGFLGSEKEFNSTYGKPIQASRDAKCSSKDQEAGILALQALHR